MKFNDGCWLLQPGVTISAPAQAYEVNAFEHSLTILAPAAWAQNRGMTLQGPLFQLSLSSPADDITRVSISHFRSPVSTGFDVIDNNVGQAISGGESAAASFTTGAVAVNVVDTPSWSVDFLAGGAAFTKSGRKGMGTAATPDGVFTFAQLSLGVGECVYGLGERFTSFVKNGQVVDMWNKDGGTNSDQAYKNVPFYLTNRGYGVFVNHSERVSFEIASEKADCVQFSVPGESLEFFVIYGPTPKDILRKYTALTGRAALPPAWSFGLWLSTSFTTNYDEETITSFIQGMLDRDLPLSVFHFDCFWMREFHWCDFQWDQRVFPDPAGMLARLHERGLKVCVWINPYISAYSCLFKEGEEAGFFLKKSNGVVWQSDQWQPGMAVVDFTNPGACRWYASKLKALIDIGVDSFKTDFGERIPTDVVYFDGSDPIKMHNLYSYIYNKCVFDLLVHERGNHEAIVFARSATAGSQKMPVHWGGDCESTFEAMAASLRGGLSFGLSGFSFWSHDIGGFEGTPPVALYKRWVAFGLLSSHSRLHGSSSYRVPWVYGEDASDVLGFFTRLKCSLMPYLYAKAIEAHESGVPMMRSMLLEFPDDPGCDYLDRQYMLGDSLLVAPILREDNIAEYYVPTGTWTNYFTSETVNGPCWRKEEHDFKSVPLLVRAGSIIAVGSSESRPDYDYFEGVTIKVYQLADGRTTSVSIPTVAGETVATVSVSRVDNQIRVKWSKRPVSWNLLVVGIRSWATEIGGSSELTNEGLLIRNLTEDEALVVIRD